MSYSDDDDADYCWCGSRVSYLQTVGRWLCHSHGYQDHVYAATPLAARAQLTEGDVR